MSEMPMNDDDIYDGPPEALEREKDGVQDDGENEPEDDQPELDLGIDEDEEL